MVSWSWANQPTWPMHLSYNELHRQAGKLSFCHRNIAGNHNIEGQHQQLVWLQCLRQTLLVNLLMEKFYPWTSTLFQGSRTGGKLLLRFSTVTCLSSTSSSVQWKFCCKINYTVGVVPSLCSRMKGVFCITVVYLVIGSTSDFLASSIWARSYFTEDVIILEFGRHGLSLQSCKF